MIFSRLAGIAIASMLLATSLHAQTARRVPGYWAGLGAGGASAGLTCDDCIDTDSRFGPSIVISLGRTFSPRLSLALEANGWWKGVDGTVDHQGYLMVAAQVFAPRGGAYFTGSAGVARFASVVGRGGDRTSSLAPALGVGAGYDLAFGREVSIAPFVNYFRSLSNDLKINGNATGTKLSQHMIQAGVGLHWNFSGAISFPKPTP